MKGTIYKRIFAYVLDILLVTLLTTVINYIPVLNANKSDYEEKYNELLNVNEQYQKSEISKDEYEQAYEPIAYEVYRLNTNYTITNIILVVLYFGVLPFFLNGQTLGKKLFQIRIVSANDKPLTLVNYLLRCIVLNNTLISIASLITVYQMDVDHFYPVYQNINIVGYIIIYLTLFMALVRKDNRGLHDLVAGTKVELTDEGKAMQLKKLEEEQKVLEAEDKDNNPPVVEAKVEPVKEENKKEKKTIKKKASVKK